MMISIVHETGKRKKGAKGNRNSQPHSIFPNFCIFLKIIIETNIKLF